jgi:hypothetical protein
VNSWLARAGKPCNALAAVALAAPVFGHDIRVYSEFSRIDPFGQIVQADRGAGPREILSPAIPRNAFSGFHVIVIGNPGEAFTLHVGQNPDDAVRITVYRETYTRFGDEWIPDGLTRIDLPYSTALGSDIPGQTAQAFWMDLWAAAEAPVRRIKVEPEVLMYGRWILYPMEVRVVQAVASGSEPSDRFNPPDVSLPADASAQAALRATLCPASRSRFSSAAVAAPTVRSLIARDARQDLRIAGGPEQIWQNIHPAERAQWCSGYQRDKSGPESFLRIRDRIYRAAEQ